MSKTYLVYNGPMVTTGSPAKVATGAGVKTMLQLKWPTGGPTGRIIEWGGSFDGTVAASPGVVELVETGTVSATVTAFASADVYPVNDPNAVASAVTLGTSASGYTSTSEGAITATRQLAGPQLIAPTSEAVFQVPLGYHPEVKAGNILRIRCNFGTTINGLVYVIWEE